MTGPSTRGLGASARLASQLGLKARSRLLPWRRCSTRRAAHRGAVMEIELLRDAGAGGSRAEPPFDRMRTVATKSLDDLRGDAAMYVQGVSTRKVKVVTEALVLGAHVLGGGRRRGNQDACMDCWRRFGPISRGPRSTANPYLQGPRAVRKVRLDGVIQSPARGCCASCGRNGDCSAPHPRASGALESRDALELDDLRHPAPT